MIYTFYSYKGGVGRSMALANVAACFCRQGLRVVMVDWDLEAPGLETFFYSSAEDLYAVYSELGILGLLQAYKREYPALLAAARRDESGDAALPDQRWEPVSAAEPVAPAVLLQHLERHLPPLTGSLHEIKAPPGERQYQGGLWLLPAGWRTDDRFAAYSQGVQTFDWTEFYTAFSGEVFFDWLRTQLEDFADVVLIDSRTGVTEMGGVCTRQLSDIVVTFCAPNWQNLTGVAMMARSFCRPEVLQARQRGLKVVVIPARVEYAETSLLNLFKAQFLEQLGDFGAAATWELGIPYVPKYAYSEVIAVGTADSSELIENAYRKLAAYLGLMSPYLRSRAGAEWKRLFGGVLPLAPFMAPRLPEGYVVLTAQFAKTKSLLLDRPPAGAGSPVALVGPGGVGKTILAAALCHDKEVTQTCKNGVLWVTLGKDGDPLAAAQKVFAELTGDETPFADVAEATQRLGTALSGKDCLLVLDDVRDPVQLRPFLRLDRRCSCLFTTRNLRVADAASARIFEVAPLSMRDSRQILLADLETTPADPRPLFELVERLDGLPLALSLARAQLRQLLVRGRDMDSAVRSLNQGLQKMGLTWLDGSAPDDFARLADVFASSQLSLREDERRRYQELAVFPGDIDIPLQTVAALWGVDADEAAGLAASLNDLSLLTFDPGVHPEDTTLRLHELLRDQLAREVADFPSLHRRLVASWKDRCNLPDKYAWTWLTFHLAGAGMASEARDLLLDFPWLQAKLAATGAAGLASGYRHLPGDEDLQLVQDAIRLSFGALGAGGTTQLAGQLIGRMSAIKKPDIVKLLGQAREWAGSPWLQPQTASLTAPGGQLLCTLRGHSDDVTGLLLTPDGRSAISASADTTIKRWDLQTGDELATLRGHTGEVTAIAITPDGRRLISTAKDRTLRIWDLEDEEEVLTVRDLGNDVTALAVTGDARWLILSFVDGMLRIWDAETGAERLAFRGHSRRITDVAVLPDDQRFVSGSSDGTLRIWNLESGERTHTLGAGKERKGGLWLYLASAELEVPVSGRSTVTAVAPLPDGQRILAASFDGRLKIWDIEEGTERLLRGGHPESISAVALIPDGRRFVSASADTTLQVWDLDGGETRPPLQGHTRRVRAVAVAPDGRIVVSASDDRTLKIWSLERRSASPAILAPRRAVTCLAMTPDGQKAVSGSEDGCLQVWTDPWAAPVRLGKLGDAVTALAVTPDGQRVISASQVAGLKVWDLAGGTEVLSLAASSSPVLAVAVTPNGQCAIAATEDCALTLWDLATGKELRSIQLEPNRATALAVLPDGRRLVFGAPSSNPKVIDLGSGAELLAFQGQGWGAAAIAVAPDGKTALLDTASFALKLWNLETGSELLTLNGHADVVTGVALTGDQRLAVSSSLDGTLRVWDLATGNALASFNGDSPLSACAAAPAGRSFLAGEESGRVHFLRLAGTQLVEPLAT